MFCEESLGKTNAKDDELFWNGSVHEFYRLKMLITLEQVNTSVVVKRKNLCEEAFDGEVNWSGVVNFHFMQMSLVMSMRLIFGDDWNVTLITFLLFGNDLISLESRPLIFAYLYTCTQSIQKQIVEYDIDSK